MPHAYWLLWADLIAMAVVPADFLRWEVSSISVDLSDILLAATVLLLAAGPDRPTWRRIKGIPLISLWLAYGLLRSLAYLNAPTTGAYATGIESTAYQLYRYCWKPLLYYPLAAVLLRGTPRRETTIFALLLAADIAAVEGIVQGYSGILSTGFFQTKNQFGGYLIIPLVLALFRTILPWPSAKARLRRAFYVISFIMLVRTLIFTGSRGAFLATLFGSLCLVAGLYLQQTHRQRIKRAIMFAMIIAVGVLAMKPDLFQRPRVAFLMTASNPTEVDNFQWREERWQHFMGKVWEHPWLGTWSDNDFDLGEVTNTPHNGYLSIAVISGVPSLIVLALLTLAVLDRARRAAQRAPDRDDRAFAIAAAACTLGVLLHNTSESTLTLPFVGAPLWVLFACAVTLPLKHRKPARAAVTTAWKSATVGPVTARAPETSH